MMGELKSSEVLEAAATLIEPEGRWCRNWTALYPIKNDPNGRRCQTLATDPEADQWGGVGAIFKVGMSRGLAPSDCWKIQEIAARCVGVKRWFSDWAWSIDRTQAEVVQALRDAAALARSEGQ